MKRHPRILVYSAGDRDGTTVEAASRAGALGVVDLAWLDLPGLVSALPSLRQVARRSNHPFAVRVDARQLTPDWLSQLPSSASIVIAVSTSVDSSDILPGLATIQQAGRTAWAEVTSREAASQAERVGALGLILAGHEAGGFVGDDSSFTLLQAVVERVRIPVWVRGGVGPRVAAGCVAAGATGVVLDGAVLLSRESSLPREDRAWVECWDGAESRIFGPSNGPQIRAVAAPNSPLLDRLIAAGSTGGLAWDATVRADVGWKPGQAWPVGQDAALAENLARAYPSLGDLVRAVDRAIERQDRTAVELSPLGIGSPLALAHGTTYPILQGPMTRVSDVVEFADAVARGGALPFLALAMLRGPEVEALLLRAKVTMADQPWGVGLLGFVPPELRQEQTAAVLAARPPFALIAGGRPDQAQELDQAGITTYLHVPSPGLLNQFVRAGGRRFVLEARECGGHVGPQSSFVLWEQALDVVDRAVAAGAVASDFHLVFAGGIHDARSARFVAALAASVAKAGVKVGVLLGTAYLFTTEAVATGAIVERYQTEAVRCGRTVLRETGPSHEVRVGTSPSVATTATERQRLRSAKADSDTGRVALEELHAGRHRVASKGVDRVNGFGSPLVEARQGDQFDNGIYMWGQVATLKDRVTTILELHQSIARYQPTGDVVGKPSVPQPADIAIVGMSAIMPGAGDVRTFWENTLRGHDAVTEIPSDRWDWRLYYDADPAAPDKVVSKWGGFVPDVPFDPLRYGMPPTSLPSIEPVQLLLLEATRAAIDDAGYTDRPFAKERTAVVLGMGGGAAQLAMGYAFRSYLPMLDAVNPGSGQATLDACQGLLPEWTEDSFPGFLLNVAAGRLANRFDLGGANYTVDAACGSSLAAAALAVRELESGSANVVLLGGADTVQNPFTYLAFSKTHAFSPRGRCRPFDASADGIVISEGVAMVVLKRLSDAERDGDRIYAVIKGIGASSDGRARGLTAPSLDGQVRAVERAYSRSGVDPKTVGYVEAHGTGTAVGDVVEVNAIAEVFRRHGVASGSVAIGSVKSMIGHTKCAAGLAGLINASLALHHRVLPPTIGVEAVNPKADLSTGPFRVNTTTRPWLQSDPTLPRRAGVSAFGFGGTNFHAVLEAYDAGRLPDQAPRCEWPAELLVWRVVDEVQLGDQVDALLTAFGRGARPLLRDLARSLNAAYPPLARPGPTLAIVAGSLDELTARLQAARTAIRSGQPELNDPRGVYYQATPKFAGAPVAFLFPGQGSQYPGMLADLAITFAEVHAPFERFDAACNDANGSPVGPLVFPPPTTDEAERSQAIDALAATELAQPAIGAASVGLLRLLGSFGIDADLLAGHSFGELVALHAAGVMSVEGLARLARDRGRLLQQAQTHVPGAMAAVSAGFAEVAAQLASFRRVVAVNENGPAQTVIAGPSQDLAAAIRHLKKSGLKVKRLPVTGAFHTDLVAGAREPLTRAARSVVEAIPDRPVFSNLDARPYPDRIETIADQIGEHAVRPVRFGATVTAMHDAGARVFVEVGPGSVLTGLVGSILGNRPHLAVACDSASKPGISTLLTTLARLAVAGVPVQLDRLTEGRSERTYDLSNLPVDAGSPTYSSTTWLVNGSRSRPIDQPEPRRLGQSADLLGLARPTSPLHSPAQNGRDLDGSRNGFSPTSLGTDHPENVSLSHGKVMTPPKPSANPSKLPLPMTGGSAEERVLASFQETMRSFLDVQRETMIAFLGSRSAVAPVSSSKTESPAFYATPAPSSAILPPPARDQATMTPPPAPAATREAEPLGEPVFASSSAAHPVTLQTVEPMGRDAVAGRLIEIVRDRTGYPAEMLGLELDLEADLGIDSIKRVEILGSLRDSVAVLSASSDASTMDSLSRAKTLGAIVDRVDELVRRSHSQAIPTPAISGGNGRERRSAAVITLATADVDADPEPAPTTGTVSLRRLVIESVPAPLASFGAGGGLIPGGVVVVTDDGRGVGRTLASRLEAEGHPVVLAGPSKFDLASPASVDLLLAKARARGPLAAIVHADPLRMRDYSGLDAGRWADQLGSEVKGLFLLAKAAVHDLERAARRGGAALIAATPMGGAFGSTQHGGDFFAGHGGIAGLVKTLAREWPGVRARVVDLDIRDEVATLAERILEETLVDNGWAEVGYQRGQRIRLATTPARLDRTGVPRVTLDPGEPVVITGGARGITAATAVELARAWRPTLLLIGQSALPPVVEDLSTAGIEAVAPLKAAILAKLRREGTAITPADLDRAYRAVRQEREIRANLAAIRAAGSTVEYAQADVRNAASLAPVLDGWRQRFGPAVGLVHGAGVIQDKLIRDKTLASFEMVLSTKIDGALNLARLMDPASLRFTAFFSSISGRFGNLGQADYAAANEILNKLALWFDRRWPGRVVAINWGPWSEVGMVADLAGHLGSRGLGMIPPEVGKTFLLDELRWGRKGQVEVLAAGDLGNFADPIPVTRSSPDLAMPRTAGATR